MVDRDALWIVEYIPYKDMYRILRFADPDQTIGYEDYWSDAVGHVVGNYGDAVRIILVRKADGTIDYRTYNLI